MYTEKMETKDGMLQLGGVSAVELVKNYGTPVYVMDEGKIRTAMQAFRKAMEKHYGGNGLICYASKAFCCKEICRIAKSEGLGIDVAGAGEVYTASDAGFNMECAYFHGNNKTAAELKLALESGVGRVVVDNLEELKLLDSLASKLNKEINVLLRIKPGVEAKTPHEYIKTGGLDSKFGFGLETGEALAAVKAALKTKNIKLKGIHCHIGSQILYSQPFKLTAEIMVGFLAQIKKETGAELAELNLGGGFGVVYTQEDKPVPIDEMVNAICQTIKKAAKENNLKQPFLVLEPGRSIVAEAGSTLYTVGNVKVIPNIRTYVAVDGGMFENPRYALYKSKYEMLIANKANQLKDTSVTVVGKCCESGDKLGESVPLQKAEAGDILAVLGTGAYNFSMASNYNRNVRPPVVTVNNGSHRLIVKAAHPRTLSDHDI